MVDGTLAAPDQQRRYGFRCVDPHLVPAPLWRSLIEAVRQRAPDCRFLAWTPGLAWDEIAQLRGAGFAARSHRCLGGTAAPVGSSKSTDCLRGIGSVIACPEAPFRGSLARRFEGHGNMPAVFRHQLHCAAAMGEGILIPMGFEFAANDDMERCTRGPDGGALVHNGNNLDLADGDPRSQCVVRPIASPLNGEIRILNSPSDSVTALLRSGHPRCAPRLRSNRHHDQSGSRARSSPSISLRPLPSTAGASLSVVDTISADHDGSAPLDPGEVRVLRAKANDAVKLRRSEVRAAALECGAAHRHRQGRSRASTAGVSPQSASLARPSSSRPTCSPMVTKCSASNCCGGPPTKATGARAHADRGQ